MSPLAVSPVSSGSWNLVAQVRESLAFAGQVRKVAEKWGNELGQPQRQTLVEIKNGLSAQSVSRGLNFDGLF